MEQFFVPQDAAQNAPQGKNVKQQVKMSVEDFIALAKRLIAEYKLITFFNRTNALSLSHFIIVRECHVMKMLYLIEALPFFESHTVVDMP